MKKVPLNFEKFRIAQLDNAQQSRIIGANLDDDEMRSFKPNCPLRTTGTGEPEIE